MSLALIAGHGRLPELLLGGSGPRPASVHALEGQVPDLPVPVEPFRLETLGSLIAGLRAAGVTRVCLAGAIRRPALDSARVDAATQPLAGQILQALGQGDDGALRAVTAIFEEAGLTVVGADALRPDLLPPPGVPTRARPGAADRRDAARGAEVVRALGAVDVGQGCVVAAGQVLAVEAAPGTDAMLAGLRHRPAHLPRGGLLLKAPKPGQDRRLDLPAIGADTVANAAAAGLRGIVVEAAGVLVLDAGATIAEADRQDMFIWIRET